MLECLPCRVGQHAACAEGGCDGCHPARKAAPVTHEGILRMPDGSWRTVTARTVLREGEGLAAVWRDEVRISWPSR